MLLRRTESTRLLWLGVAALMAGVMCGCSLEEPRTVAGFHWKSEVYALRLVTYEGRARRTRIPASYRVWNCRVVSTARQCGQVDMGSGVSVPITCWDDDTYCDYAYDVNEQVVVATTQGQNRAVVPPTAAGTRVDHCWVRFDTAYGGNFVPVACGRWHEFPRGRRVFRDALPPL